MSNSDLSQLSDLSGISRIRSSSIRPSEKPDSIYNLSEVRASSSIREPTRKPAIASGLHGDGSKDAIKIVTAIASCENAIADYARLELIQECVREATTAHSEALQNSTRTKLKDIIVVCQVNKYLQLPNTEKNAHEDLTLLGITELPTIQLSHNEKRDISAAVENTLREKINHFIVSYEMLGGTVKDALKNEDSLSKSCLARSDGSELMRWKEQTDEICSEYYRDLLRCADLVYQWQRLKHIDMRELNLRKAESLLLEAQVAQIQAKITTKTCAVRMFKETPRTVDAFRMLSENLDAKILEAREQLRKKTALKAAYEDVFTSGYDQVLNKYTELLKVIKKKEHLMDML